MLVALNIVILAVGVGLVRWVGLSPIEGRAIAIEAGVQNATLGIAVAGILSTTEGLSAFALPGGIYGTMMYLVTGPFIWWARRR